MKQILTFYGSSNFVSFLNFSKKRELDFINFHFVFSFSIIFPAFPTLFLAFPLWFPAFPPWFPDSPFRLLQIAFSYYEFKKILSNILYFLSILYTFDQCFAISENNKNHLTLSWRRPISYRNQSIDLRSKPMDWFLYDNGLRHEKVKHSLFKHKIVVVSTFLVFSWLIVSSFTRKITKINILEM